MGFDEKIDDYQLLCLMELSNTCFRYLRMLLYICMLDLESKFYINL